MSNLDGHVHLSRRTVSMVFWSLAESPSQVRSLTIKESATVQGAHLQVVVHMDQLLHFTERALDLLVQRLKDSHEPVASDSICRLTQYVHVYVVAIHSLVQRSLHD